MRQFMEAANMRNEEASSLAVAGHRAGAVYLWGYVAEMIFKSAWFRLIGKKLDEPIDFGDLRDAVHTADTMYHMQWGGNFHHIYNWARLLTAHRITLGRPYSSSALTSHIVSCAAVIYDRWRESLRYKRNQPYAHEARIVGSSVQWLIDHQELL